MPELTQGSHEPLVVATASDGKQLEMPTRIEIEVGGTVDGGLLHINRHYPAWLERRAAHGDSGTDKSAHLESNCA